MSSARVAPAERKAKTINKDQVKDALFAQEIADKWREDSDRLNSRIASQIRAGLELPPGMEFDLETNRIRRITDQS